MIVLNLRTVLSNYESFDKRENQNLVTLIFSYCLTTLKTLNFIIF